MIVYNEHGYEYELKEDGQAFVRNPEEQERNAPGWKVSSKRVYEILGWAYWPELQQWLSPEELRQM